MGLDMMIFKVKKHDGMTLDNYWVLKDYQYYKEYKKEHPEYHGSFERFAGRKLGSRKILAAYNKNPEEYAIEEVAYWRKANAIHAWFVDNVQDGEDDCRSHRPLTKEDLENLRAVCVDIKKHPKRAREKLPTQCGFFFGDTEYDEWYFSSIKETIEIIDRILETTNWDEDELYYESSW